MKTIEMSCPSCQKRLELDAGFAGGVCRCSFCGTLMTVPRSSGGKAEQLYRPNVPGNASASASAALKSKSAKPVKSVEAVGKFTTSSGRVVDLVDNDAVPTALQKRKGVRAVTIAAFAFVMVVLVGVCVSAIMLVTRSSGPQVLTVETFSYDRSANPLKIAEPNIMGLPLERRAVVLLDLTGVSSNTWDAMKPVLVDGLSRTSRSISLGLVIVDEDGLQMPWGDDVERLTGRTPEDLRALINGLTPRSDAGPVPALQQSAAAVADMSPDQLILIAGRAIDDAEAQPLFAAVQPKRVDAVVLDEDSAGLDNLTRETQGSYLSLDSAVDLRRWVEDAASR